MNNLEQITPLYGEHRPIFKATFMRTESELGQYAGGN
jgi:hypothetical protein